MGVPDDGAGPLPGWALSLAGPARPVAPGPACPSPKTAWGRDGLPTRPARFSWIGGCGVPEVSRECLGAVPEGLGAFVGGEFHSPIQRRQPSDPVRQPYFTAAALAISSSS